MPDNVTISYRGAKYEIGRGKRFYGIWVVGAPSSDPIDRWPLTTEGWTQAWARFVMIETPGTIAKVEKPRTGFRLALPKRPGPAGGPGAGDEPARGAAAARGLPSRAAISAGLLAGGLVLGLIGLFPGYFGSSSLTAQAELLVPHLLYLAGWAVSCALIALGARRRLETPRSGALLGAGLSAVTFGLFFADLGEVISGGSSLGPGLVLSALGWVACTAGSLLALTAGPRTAGPQAAGPQAPPTLIEDLTTESPARPPDAPQPAEQAQDAPQPAEQAQDTPPAGLPVAGPHAPGPYAPGPYPPGPYAPGPYPPGPYAPGPYPSGPYQPGPYLPGPSFAAPPRAARARAWHGRSAGSGPAKPRPTDAGPLALIVLAAIGAVAAFAPSWDSYTLTASVPGTSETITAGNAFANPGVVIAGNVAVMIAVVAVAAVAALWRPVRHGAMLLAGATVALIAQAISALIQVTEPATPAQFNITPAQATANGLTISSGLTPIFWVYCVFVISLLVSIAWMLTAPHYPAMPTAPVSPAPSPADPRQDVDDETTDSDDGAEDDAQSSYA